eukprot:12569-Heterococcus_DN1.PRE.4
MHGTCTNLHAVLVLRFSSSFVFSGAVKLHSLHEQCTNNHAGAVQCVEVQSHTPQQHIFQLLKAIATLAAAAAVRKVYQSLDHSYSTY